MKSKPKMKDSNNTWMKIHPSLVWWNRYAEEVKCDLSSIAYRALEGWVLIDPTPLPDEMLHSLKKEASLAAILITNENHSRASSDLREKHSIPIFASSLATEKLDLKVDFTFDKPTCFDLEIVPIPGATEGETCFIAPEGIAIMGDAIINLPGHEFSLLPEKYAWNPEQSKKSLRKLLDHPLDLMTFAHGSPVRGEIHQRLEKIIHA